MCNKYYPLDILVIVQKKKKKTCGLESDHGRALWSALLLYINRVSQLRDSTSVTNPKEGLSYSPKIKELWKAISLILQCFSLSQCMQAWPPERAAKSMASSFWLVASFSIRVLALLVGVGRRSNVTCGCGSDGSGRVGFLGGPGPCSVLGGPLLRFV